MEALDSRTVVAAGCSFFYGPDAIPIAWGTAAETIEKEESI
jgi:hypothetical protein